MIRAVGRIPLRVRVAGAFGLAATLVLIALGAFVQLRVQDALEDQTRAALTESLDTVARAPAATRARLVTERRGELFAQLLDDQGAVLASSPQVPAESLAPPQREDGDGDGDGDATVSYRREVRLLEEDETDVALLLARVVDGQTVVVGTPTDDIQDASQGVLAALLTGVPLAVVLATGLGYLVAGAALRPVDRMRSRAASISAGTAHERLPVSDADDELARLGHTLNAMLDRLEAALARERRFVAEASHELRTPLALLRTEIDLALGRTRSAAELREALVSAGEEVDRLTGLARDLLALSEADDRSIELSLSEFDLTELLEQVAARFAHVATLQGRQIDVVARGTVTLVADRSRVDQVVSNLLDNALTHGRGVVQLHAEAWEDQVRLVVGDQGPGVAPSLRSEVLAPFTTEGGGRAARGRGLGLAVVRALVQVHGGTLSFGQVPESDFAVVVLLPRAPRG